MKTTVAAFLIAIVTLFGCDNRANFEGGDLSYAESISMVPPPEISQPATPQAEDRKIIKEGVIRFETSDLRKSRSLIDSICQISKGYVSSEKTMHSDWDLSQTITLRLPATTFDHVVLLLESHATDVTVKDIKAKDVTEEFIDVKARLHTKHELEQRYLQLLKKAGNVDEMLKVESALASVRGEIESMEGRLQYLTSRISYSMLEVSYFKPLQIADTGYLSKIGHSILSGWDMVKAIFLTVVFLWPFIIFFTLVMVGILRFRKSRSKPTIAV